jgi:hypothetical protein
MLTKIFGVSKEIVKPFGLFLTIYLLVFGLNTYLIVYLKETYNYSSLMTVCISIIEPHGFNISLNKFYHLRIHPLLP